MKKNVLVGIFVSVVLVFVLLIYFFFVWKKTEMQKRGYMDGTGTTEITSASGAEF